MNKVKIISLTAGVLLAMAFTFSCSGDDSGGEGKYSYCVKDGFCHEGPYTLDGCNSFGGMPSNNCPNGGGSSSSIGGGQGSSSSSSGGVQNPSSSSGGGVYFNYCLINGQCLDGPFTSEECSDYFGGLPSNICNGGGNASSSSGGIIHGTPVTYEGETYPTVVIGTQTWFAKNLNYAVEGSKCYDNDPANCTIYGRLYDWPTAMTVCPSGWHLPTDAEWATLGSYIGGFGNDYGFQPLPGGEGYSDGTFYFVDDIGFWWSASECYSDDVFCGGGFHPDGLLVYVGYDRSHAYWNYDSKSSLFSVRCVQD
jgi:uncharacterized protein (TIGR02145 family)